MNAHTIFPTTRPLDPRALAADLARYRTPHLGRSLFELGVTLLPLLLLVGLAWAGLAAGWWPALLLTIPAGGFLLRLFIIQHDCGHGAFFRSRKANDWLGRALGVLTMTPYDVWRGAHAEHHASNGNLDRRGMGDVDTLTVAEYRALSPLRRLGYRLYRHPLTLLGLGPAYLFVLRNRLPIGQMRDGWRPWVSAMATNAALLLVALATAAVGGFGPFVLVQLLTILVAGAGGVWLFYVQHQFETTVWDRKAEWSFHQGALAGSSFYDLPAPLRWLTGNIGIHHVHHLVSRIPFYRLPEVLRDCPALAGVNRIGLRDSLACLRLRLWDEQSRRLVPFP
jgi:acyl-lipid omega-6 desaturase (Delta-12 desaturase)